MLLPIIFAECALLCLIMVAYNYDLEVKRIQDEDIDLWKKLGKPICKVFGNASWKYYSRIGDAASRKLMNELTFTNRHKWVRKERIVRMRLFGAGFFAFVFLVCFTI